MAAGDDPILWRLRGHGRDVRCVCHRTAAGLELHVLWGDELFLTETFHDRPRLEKRAEEFRATLESRGWMPVADEDTRPVPGASGLPPDLAAESLVLWTDTGGAPSAPAEQAAAARRPGDAAVRPRVLVVDDEASIRSFLRTYLQSAGYDVCEAEHVDGALNALDERDVDAVVLDVRLPDPMGWGRTGLEVLAFIRLHQAHSRLPVLILTGQALEPEELDLIERHRAFVFLKPDGYRMLLARLDELTGGGTIAPRSA